MNFTGPHNPQDVTTEMAGWFADARFPPASGNDDVDPSHLNRIRKNYAAMCENIDRWIGHYLDLLTERGERDETLVVFSSDHGEMLGDRDRWGKSVWYQHSIGIPIIVAGPSIACRRRDEFVQLQDLAPTFLSVANAESLPGSDTASLLPLLTTAAGNPKWDRAVARSGLNEWEARWDGRWELVVERDLPVRLYDHASDPEESTDLLAGDSLSTAAAAARDRLHRYGDKQEGSIAIWMRRAVRSIGSLM